MTTDSQKVRMTLRSRHEEDQTVFAIFWEGGDVTSEPLEVCRMPAGLLASSGMKSELTEVLAKMVSASMSGMLEDQGCAVIATKISDPKGH